MARKPAAEPPQPLKTYGMKFAAGVRLSQLEIELFCFMSERTPDEGGLGKFMHCKNAILLMWPKMVWHEWLDAGIRSLCESRYTGWAGCGAGGKTYTAAIYAMIWWACMPHDSAVILTSTTAKMIRKRQWSAIQDLWQKAVCFPGHIVDSKTIIQAEQGDDKHGIFAMPVADGSLTKAVANIQGIHCRRILLEIDEGTDTPEAIYEAESNLSKGCKDFQMLVLGNPQSRFDPHGRFCEPKDGWKSVNVEDEEWETRRGVCVRFDGMKSPNIKARKNLYPFLISIEDVKNAREFEGETSPKFWKYTRGFWAPDGVVNTVLSEAMCIKFNVEASHVFHSKYTMVAGLDPAFGGDRCILQFAKVGDREDGRPMILLDDTVVLHLDAGSSSPVSFQIAKRLQEECEMRRCKPEHVAVDSTGNGAGVCDVISQMWSNAIVRVSFGGSPTDLPISDFDSTPSNSRYRDRVTELWYSVLEWVKRDQVRGMTRDIIVEFCSRYCDIKNNKTQVEDKRLMKTRTGKSPDKADAAALAIDVARRLNARAILMPAGNSSWKDAAIKARRLYAEENMYSEAS